MAEPPLREAVTTAFVSITLASVVALILILPVFVLLNSGSLTAATAVHCALAAIESIYVSTAVTAGVELFATRVRYSGFAIGYNVCVAAFGDPVAADNPDDQGVREAPASPRHCGRNIPIQCRCSRRCDHRVATELQLGRAAAD